MNAAARILKAIGRPEYAFRPTQILRRLTYSTKAGRVWASTPWGLPIRAEAGELHGRALLTIGTVDLRVTELIWRLVHPGDRAVDIGANIGVMASLMARRVGPRGAVWAFEPHPRTRALLNESAEHWANSGLPVQVVPFALCASAGTGFLHEPAGFEANSGIARLSQDIAEQGTAGHDVETVTFDQFFDPSLAFKLVKLDVEGHEDQVLKGMASAIAAGRIENIIIEEFRPLPSPASDFLSSQGYTVFMIDRTFYGPTLRPVESSPAGPPGEPTNLLATRTADRALELVRPRGWRSLGR